MEAIIAQKTYKHYTNIHITSVNEDLCYGYCILKYTIIVDSSDNTTDGTKFLRVKLSIADHSGRAV
jgi:hypothetical protein